MFIHQIVFLSNLIVNLTLTSKLLIIFILKIFVSYLKSLKR